MKKPLKKELLAVILLKIKSASAALFNLPIFAKRNTRIQSLSRPNLN
jgi:hypothetical protein